MESGQRLSWAIGSFLRLLVFRRHDQLLLLQARLPGDRQILLMALPSSRLIVFSWYKVTVLQVSTLARVLCEFSGRVLTWTLTLSSKTQTSPLHPPNSPAYLFLYRSFLPIPLRACTQTFTLASIWAVICHCPPDLLAPA